jgi:large subunit ribosomal protein L14
MIQKETGLSCIDNSGAKRVKCIKVLRNKYGYPGNILVVSIKRVVTRRFRSKKKMLKKGEIHKVLFAFSRYGVKRKVGNFLKAAANAIIMLRKENFTLPYANRLKFGIFFEARSLSTKVVILSPNVY